MDLFKLSYITIEKRNTYSVRVEVTAGGRAAFSEVSGLMDVETVFASWHTGYGAADVNLAVILPGEGNDAVNAVTFQLDDRSVYYLKYEKLSSGKRKTGK